MIRRSGLSIASGGLSALFLGMTMLMAARYPERWKAASAWVGISDLISWHGRHRGSKYGNMSWINGERILLRKSRTPSGSLGISRPSPVRADKRMTV